jgi:hypothetical protein
MGVTPLLTLIVLTVSILLNGVYLGVLSLMVIMNRLVLGLKRCLLSDDSWTILPRVSSVFRARVVQLR